MKTTIIVFATLMCLGVSAQVPVQPLDSALKEGFQLLKGKGRQKDEVKALELFHECANRGSTEAMVQVGLMYKKGLGTAPDKTKATEWFLKAANQNYAPGWYNIGVLHKEETSRKPDFEKAYSYFVKAARMGDDQSIYAQAYMLYKGLGCSQDYKQAALLFKEGALLGRSNSMYFYGLCWRNGYGVPMDADSAKFWLKAAAKKNYGMAIRELATPRAENQDQHAKQVAARIRNVVDPNGAHLNKYKKVNHNITANSIEGEFTGNMIRYDWSGQSAIGASTVALNLKYEKGELKGVLIENDTLSIPIEAALTPYSLNFKNTQYKRKDHYSPKKSISYIFEQARLQLVQRGDSIFLAGNIQMFSPERNEPEKPVFILLYKTNAGAANDQVDTAPGKDALVVKNETFGAHPNPFTNTIVVEFELKQKSEVEVQLLSADGKLVYTNKAGILESGYYTLPIRSNNVTAGTYIVVLKYGNQKKTFKVVKQ